MDQVSTTSEPYIGNNLLNVNLFMNIFTILIKKLDVDDFNDIDEEFDQFKTNSKFTLAPISDPFQISSVTLNE